METLSLVTANSGIYVITNTENGKVYIGSTVDFKRRWREHRGELLQGVHYNSYLQRSWNKYGKNAFEFGILEYLDDPEELVKAEQFWMDVYYEEGKELFNSSIAADRPMLGRKHTQESKQKMSGAAKGYKHTEEAKRKIAEASSQRDPISEETRHKMSEASSGRKYGPMSEEQKRKISKAKKGHTTSEETKRKLSKAQTGKKHSKETKSKMSKSIKAAWARGVYDK